MVAQRRANLFNNDLGEPDDGRFGGVGALLRRRREELQQDIDDVSRQLRIRSTYIRAIEEGKFQELPGTAYAVGFVRAYADYLGLDGGHVVGDYRDELARRSRQNDLVWPTEGTESRFPGGAILVVCLLLGLFIYGGWYYATQSGGTGIKLIDQVPEYIKKATGVGQEAENAAPAETPDEPTRTEAQADTTPVPSQGAPAPAQTTANPAPAQESAAVNPAPAPTPPPAVVLSPSNSATVGGNAPAVVATPGMGTSTPQTPAAPTTAAPAPAAPSAPVQTAEAPATPTPPAPEAPAIQTPAPPAEAAATPVPPPARVVIRANRDAWIEIRDKDDAVLMQRVLRQGESFNVPDQKGLVMTTGNAGGIVIELEGKPMQSLGSLGVVKRGIKLDPSALADGSAFITDDSQ